MKKILILVVAVLWGSLWNDAFGQKMTAMKNVADGVYNFWLYEPQKSANNKIAEEPLVIFLHGASLKGTDMRKVLKYGPLNAVNRGININAYVVAPQTSDNWDADKIWKCVEWVKEHYPIDTNRISVIGMSLGGFGTFTLATKYYDKLSAGMMLCGGNTNENYCGLTKMPFWIMHGTADKAVPITRSNSIVNSMAACGDTSRLIYTKLVGANHSFPAKVFYLTEIYDWLTSHSLKDKKRAVNRKTSVTQEMIAGAYGRLSDGQNTMITTVVEEKTDTNKTHVASAKEEKKKVQDKKMAYPQYHVVRKGNTLYWIAKRYNTSIEVLCKLNKLDRNATLQVGQKIKLPKRK